MDIYDVLGRGKKKRKQKAKKKAAPRRAAARPARAAKPMPGRRGPHPARAAARAARAPAPPPEEMFEEEMEEEFEEEEFEEEMEETDDETSGYVGVSLRKLNLKKALRKVDWKKVAAVAMKAGPIVATVFPAAAPFVAAGLILNKAAAEGDPKALAKIAEIKRGAAKGDPDAQASLAALQTSAVVQAKVQS